MSEKEILIFIKRYSDFKKNKQIINSIDKNFFFNLIDGLLDLYNKEKEENKKLRQCHFKYEEMTGIDLLLED